VVWGGGCCWGDDWRTLIDGRISLFGGDEAVRDGLERKEKKEEERAGAEDDVDAEGVWAFRDGRDIPEDLVVVVA
jgi:hypothetical protein